MISKIINFKTNYVWTTRSFSLKLFGDDSKANLKRTERCIIDQKLNFDLLADENIQDEYGNSSKVMVLNHIFKNASSKRKRILFVKSIKLDEKHIIFANDRRNGRRWIFSDKKFTTRNTIKNLLKLLVLNEGKDTLLIPSGLLVSECRKFKLDWQSNKIKLKNNLILSLCLEIYNDGKNYTNQHIKDYKLSNTSQRFNHLDKLEAEAIHIMREVVAEANNPVMLYSIGKDSAVMLHLAKKAFYPSTLPFPLMHIDTRWKFQDMYNFRDYIVKKNRLELITYINPEGIKKNINPFDHGPSVHTDIMKTQALKLALDNYKFDVAFGGARRDEEKSRAKERIFSFRNKSHNWDPKNQRPELWQLYNCKKDYGESIRVFPLSNWTELDIWLYIYREKIEIVPLYFASERPIINRDGLLIMVDDDRIPLLQNEKIKNKKIRFRSLGCYPLTGAIESNAYDVSSIIIELLTVRNSERNSRAIDFDKSASMEKKKKEGYF